MKITISGVRRALARKLKRVFGTCTSDPSAPDPVTSPEPKSASAPEEPPTSRTSSFRALVIGINKYKHADGDTFEDLRGCVADADDMCQYLTQTRGLSPDDITVLRDEDATRENILAGIRALKDANIRRDAPILIFWAGHGSRARTAAKSTQHVEMLIPYDFNPRAKNRQEQGVPDYMLGRLLSELAQAKGNNITVILDACHAGSSTRQAAGPQVRGFDLPPDYVLDVPDFEAEESASRAMGPSTTSGWSADLTSHVLLAATSSSHPAREENGRGIFTRALLSFLREHTQPELLTYSDVILGLPPLGPAGVQQPQCEGKNAGRHLFRTSKPGHGYRFRLQDDVVIVEAGELHGVNKDAVFDLYARLHLDQAPLLRGLKSERLNAGHTMLRLPPATTLTTTEGWALQTSSSTAARASVVVDLSYDNWSPTTVSQSLCDFDADHAGRVRLALVCDDRQQLLITKDAGEKLTFDLTDEVCRGVGVERLRHSMRSDSDRLHETLAAASEFFHYLGYSNPQRPLHDFVQVEMHLLKYLDGAPAPVGENLLVDGRTFVPNHVYDMEDPGPHECYGLRVTNNYSEPLYAWIFAFNMNDLSIDEVYRPVLAKENTDVCIEPHDVLTIGYGNGGVVPQAFFVPEGESTAVTHLKIFVSTTRLELGHISQGSPFCSGRGMKISRRGMPSIVWDTLVVTAIQQRTENGA